MCEEYNGWTNRETWATALHLDNNQGIYNEVQDYTRGAIENNPIKEAPYRLADTLEEWVNAMFEFDNISENRALFSMLEDIGSLYRVNWREIAQGYIDTMVSDSAIGLQDIAL